MKNLKSLTAILLVVLFASARMNAQEKKHVDASSWKELKEFHQVMAQTFHPAEEGNYKPVRERSGELYEKALALEKSTPPADFKTPEIATAVKELSAKAHDVNNLTKRNVSDEELMKALTAAHNSFHKIVGLCRGGDEEHGEHHDEKTKE